jgi:hypothetical protein
MTILRYGTFKCPEYLDHGRCNNTIVARMSLGKAAKHNSVNYLARAFWFGGHGTLTTSSQDEEHRPCQPASVLETREWWLVVLDSVLGPAFAHRSKLVRARTYTTAPGAARRVVASMRVRRA